MGLDAIGSFYTPGLNRSKSLRLRCRKGAKKEGEERLVLLEEAPADVAVERVPEGVLSRKVATTPSTYPPENQGRSLKTAKRIAKRRLFTMGKHLKVVERHGFSMISTSKRPRSSAPSLSGIQVIDADLQLITGLGLLDRTQEEGDEEGQAVLVHGVDIGLGSRF